MPLEFALETTRGRRPDNQDRVHHFESSLGTIFVLADGMGGHQGGGVAASLTIAEFKKALQALPESYTADLALVEAIQAANLSIYNEGLNGDVSLRRMGSTIAALLLSKTPEGLLSIGAHVGDSRLYFSRDGRFFRLTQDHTMIQELLRNSTLTEEEANDHPQAGILTRALGQKETIQVDLTAWMLLKPGDTFLICSDGLSGVVNDVDIAQHIQCKEGCSGIALGLLDLATDQGSGDNISVIVARLN